MSIIVDDNRIWLPFTPQQIEWLRSATEINAAITYALSLDKVIELADSKIRCREILRSWPKRDGRMARALRRDEAQKVLELIELEIE